MRIVAGRRSVPELLRGVSHNLRGGQPNVYIISEINIISDFILINPCYIPDDC